MADINKIKLGDTQYDLGATKIKAECDWSTDVGYELLSKPRQTNGQFEKANTCPNMLLYPSADGFYALEYSKFFEGGPTVVIGGQRAADCVYEYDAGWEDENGEWVEDWYTDFDISVAGTGHLEVAGNLIVGGGEDIYGIFPYRHNYSTIGDSSHKWYEIHGTNIYADSVYQGGSRVLTSHQTIKQDGITGATIKRYGVCSTAAGTAAKTVSITNGTFSLETGVRVTVKFSNANTATTPTLNVGSKGAKAIYHNGVQITTGTNKALLAGVCDFVYDGTQWHLVGNYIDTDTKVGYTSSTGNSEYPILFKNSTGSTTTAGGAYFNTAIKVNPSTGTLAATAFSGSGASLTSLNAGNITNGTLAVARGGTGITSNPSMLTNLGSTTAASVFATSPRPGVTGTLPIANGGTGQVTRVNAQSALSWIGDNPITSVANDTTTNWGALGHGIAFYSTEGLLTDQAQQYGLILNVPKQKSTEVFQLWHDQPSGNLRHRGGNASNWSGTWRTCLDSINYTDYVTRSAIGLSDYKYYLYYFNGTFSNGATGWFEGCVLSTWNGATPSTNGGLWNVLKSDCIPIHFSGVRNGKQLLRIWTTASASANYFDVVDTSTFTISTQNLTVSNSGMTFNTVVKRSLLFQAT